MRGAKASRLVKANDWHTGQHMALPGLANDLGGVTAGGATGSHGGRRHRFTPYGITIAQYGIVGLDCALNLERVLFYPNRHIPVNRL